MGLPEYFIMAALAKSFEHGELVTYRNVTCMAQNIWFESRGENLVGKIKVGTTVMKRLYSEDFPNSVCGVIWYPSAFSWTTDEYPNSVTIKTVEEAEIFEEIVSISIRVLSNDFDLAGATTHYWAHDKIANPCWKDGFDRFEVHGNHTWAFDPNGKSPCWDSKRIALNDTK